MNFKTKLSNNCTQKRKNAKLRQSERNGKGKKTTNKYNDVFYCAPLRYVSIFNTDYFHILPLSIED